MSSETEVTNIRRPGALIFSLDNEIMTVQVAAGVNAATGKVITFNDDNFAILATPANFDVTKGYGVVIHEGFNNTGGADGAGVVQIATGNAYVALMTGGVIEPFKDVTPDADSNITQGVLGDIPTGSNLDALPEIADAVTTLHNFVKRVLGKCYGNPGEMVNPRDVADDGVAVVRLGR